jgi:hypothetical protein
MALEANPDILAALDREMATTPVALFADEVAPVKKRRPPYAKLARQLCRDLAARLPQLPAADLEKKLVELRPAQFKTAKRTWLRAAEREATARHTTRQLARGRELCSVQGCGGLATVMLTPNPEVVAEVERQVALARDMGVEPTSRVDWARTARRLTREMAASGAGSALGGDALHAALNRARPAVFTWAPGAWASAAELEAEGRTRRDLLARGHRPCAAARCGHLLAAGDPETLCPTCKADVARREAAKASADADKRRRGRMVQTSLFDTPPAPGLAKTAPASQAPKAGKGAA